MYVHVYLWVCMRVNGMRWWYIICVQLCAQKWECMYKGQTRTSDVLLSASLPYSLGIVTLINPEDSRLSATSVVLCPN